MLLAVIISAVTISAAQIGGITTSPPGPRTGMIVGQVVDATTGRPLADSIVRLGLDGYSENLPDTPNGRVMSDGEGRFFFSELPPGDYFVEATSDGYIRGSYGQRRPWGKGQRVSLAPGQRRSDIELRVWQYGVIGGTVVDEAGEPVVGIAVRALVRDVVAGRTRFGNTEVIPELVPAAITDDRGMFRLSQLTPGTYVVVVPSTQTTVPSAVLQNADTTIRNELFWAGVMEVSLLGQPRTLQMGDFALMTQNRVLVPPPPTPSGRMQVYRTTYYPNMTSAAAAMPISLKSGGDRTDLTITLRPTPAVRVSGRLVTPEGSAAPPMTIRLLGEAMTGVTVAPGAAGEVSLETVTGLSDAAGRFTLLGVPAGEYLLTQANPFLSRADREGKTAYWVAQPLTVGSQDIADLVVRLEAAFRLSGRIELRHDNDRSPQPAFGPPGLMFETPFGEPGRVAVSISRETSTFSTLAAGGRYIIRPYETRDWFVQSVSIDGKDVTDQVLDVQGDTTSIVVTYTDRPIKFSGTVTNAQGAASATAVVLAFPTNRQLWSGYGETPRIFKTAVTTNAGAYTFDHLPPGEYYLVAVESTEMDGWQDPVRLEALAGVAARITVNAGSSLNTLDLRVHALR
jgi:hypothetical protein